MERVDVDGAAAIAAMIDLGTDLTWRHLADRDELSASAMLTLNRVYREGPMRLTARTLRACLPAGRASVAFHGRKA